MFNWLEDFTFGRRVDAEQVIEDLLVICERDGSASFADFKKLIGRCWGTEETKFVWSKDDLIAASPARRDNLYFIKINNPVRKSDELLVIKLKALLSTEQQKQVHEAILKQKETGVILLPAWCDVEVVSGDVKIAFDDNAYKEMECNKNDDN